MNLIARMMKRYIKTPLKYALPLLFICSLVLVSISGCTSSTNSNQAANNSSQAASSAVSTTATTAKTTTKSTATKSTVNTPTTPPNPTATLQPTATPTPTVSSTPAPTPTPKPTIQVTISGPTLLRPGQGGVWIASVIVNGKALPQAQLVGKIYWYIDGAYHQTNWMGGYPLNSATLYSDANGESTTWAPSGSHTLKAEYLGDPSLPNASITVVSSRASKKTYSESSTSYHPFISFGDFKHV